MAVPTGALSAPRSTTGRHRAGRRTVALGAVLALLAGVITVLTVWQSPEAEAAVQIPFTADFNAQANGAITLVGNSQLSCPASTACTTARTTAASASARSGVGNNDFAMVFVDADADPSTGNSTSADLVMPAGSTVLYAKLIWGGRRANGNNVQTVSLAQAAAVKFRTPGATSYTALTGAVDNPNLTTTTDYSPYVSQIDVTNQVRAAGNGTYWIADMAAATGADRYAGWALAVAYRNPAAPLRDLRIYRGFANVNGTGAAATATVNISGFLTPAVGVVNSAVGVVAWEGDRGLVGDAMEFNGTALSDATRPASNFFDSSVSDAGVDRTNRNPAFTNNFGFDIGRINTTNVLANSQTSTNIRLSTAGDTYYPTMVTTQIDLFSPAFNPVSKTVTNLNGNSPAKVGDTLQYQISLTNTGSDPADNSVLTDNLPPDVTFVPGSMVMIANPGAPANQPISDSAGNDVGEYLAGTRQVRIRVGAGATGTLGGSIGLNQTVTARFQVTVDRAAAGAVVSNSADLTYRARTLGTDYVFTGNAADVPVAAIADLGVTKTSTPVSQVAGQQVTYTLTATNNGPNDATGVVLTDTLPAGVAYTGSTPPAGTSCTASGQVVTCTSASLPNGATLTVPITAAIAPGVAQGSTLTDTATISSAVADDVPGNNTAVAGTAITRSADVAVTHSATPGTVTAGNQVTWTATTTNNGPSTAAGVVLTEPLPAGVTFVSASTTAGSCTQTAGTVSCPVGDLGPGGQAVVTIVATVNPTTPAGTLSATATASSPTADPNPANNAAAAPITVVTAADLQVQAVASTDPVTAGTTETYTFTVTNDGPSDAVDATFSVPTTAGLTAVSASPGQGTCTITGGAVSCALGSIPAGGSVTVTVQAGVAPGRAPGPLGYTGSAVSTTTDPAPGNNTATAGVTVQAAADLSLTKTANPTTIVFGTPVTYTLTVANAGPSTATGVQLSDPLPAGLTFESSASGCTAAGGVVTCPVGSLAPGATATRTFVAQTDAGGSGTVSNVATATATTADPNPANNSATANSTTATEADLQLTKSAPAAPVAGGPITYTLTLLNNGPSAAAGVVVTDDAPAGLTFTSVATDGSDCILAGASVSCGNVGPLPAGATRTYFVSGTVAAAALGSSANTATVTSTTTDPTPGNNSATATSVITASADVGVVLAPAAGQSSTVTAGELVNFTVSIVNNGPSTATGVVVSGQVPPGLEPVPGSSGGACTESGGTVTCVVGNLPPGAVLTVPLQTRVLPSTDAGPVSGTAVIGSATPDPVTANNSSSTTLTVVTRADLQVAKSVDTDPLVAGGPAVYTLTVTNPGPSDARAVQISDTLAADLAVLGASPSQGTCTVTGQTVDCTDAVLPAGSAITVTVPVTVDPGAVGPIGNTVTVTSPTDPNTANNTATISTAVVQRAHLVLTKSQNPATVVAGSAVVYTLALTNTGPSDAFGTLVGDPLPGNLTVLPGGVSSTGDSCAAAADNRSVSCDFGIVPPGEVRTAQITAAVPADLAPGTVLENVATVTSTTPDTDPSGRTATSTGSVTTSADLGVTLAPVQDPAEAGSAQGYVLTVANGGPSVARGAVVTFTLPPGATFVSAQPGVGTCSTGGGVVTCVLGDLAPGATATVQLGTILDPNLGGSTLTPRATVVSAPTTGDPTPDPVPANNTSTVTQNVAARADLTLTKAITSGPVVAGSPVTYRLEVTNNGPSTAANPVITDTIPAGTTAVSATASDNGTCRLGATVRCSWPSLASGASRSVTLVIAVPATTAAGTVLTNTASAASDTFNSTPAAATATAAGTVTTSADLSAVKSVLSGNPVAGGTVQWQIVVRNAGPSAANQVVLADTAAPGVSFTAAMTGTGTCTVVPGSLDCALGSVPAGGTVVVTLSGALAADYAGDTLGNTATVTSTTPDPDPADNAGSVISDTLTAADLTLTKTASPAVLVAGSPATWTITAVNDGPSVARDVEITDVVPAAVGAVAVDLPGGTCTLTPGTGAQAGSTVISCTTATLADGASAVVTVTGTVGADFVGPNLSNTARVRAATPDPDTADNAATATSVVTTLAELTLASAAPTAVNAGETITWTLTATNNGPSTAQGVTLTDTLPPGVTAVVGTGPAGACVVTGSTVVCAMGAIPAGGTATVTLTATVPANATGTLVNGASVSTSTTESSTANNAASSTTQITSAATVSLTKTFTAGTAAVPGSAVSWTVQAVNAGPSDATAVVVTDTVPSGVTGITAVYGPAATPCTVTGQDVSCPVGTLPPVTPVQVTLTGTLGAGFTAPSLGNTATVTATQGTATATSSTPVNAVADLRLGKVLTSGAPVAGAPATFELRVTDLGPSTATGVVVTDELPAELTGATATVTGSTGTCSITGRSLSCDLGTVAVGSTPVVTVTGTLSQSLGSLLTNTATVTGAATDPNPANNTSTATGSIGETADLRVTTTGPTTAVAGTPITFEVVVQNDGPSDARQVSLTDLLPAGITGVVVTPSGGTPCSPAACDLGTFPAGASLVLTVTGTVSPSTPAGTVLTQAASVSSPSPDPNGDNNSAATTVTVTTAARLAVAKTVGPDPLVPGRDATYTVTVTNAGPSDARSTVATDPLQDGLSLRTPGATADQGSCAPVGRVQACDLGIIAAGQTVTITVPVSVDPAFSGTTIGNTATVTSPTPDTDPSPGVRDGSVTTDVVGLADLTLTKTGPATVIAGQPLAWTIAVSNAGPSVARQVVVTDVLPTGLTGATVSTDRGNCALAGADLTCTVGDLAPGDTARVQIFLQGTVDPALAAGPIVNTATVTSPTTEPGQDPTEGRSATATTEVTRSADLAVTMAPLTPVFTPGSEAGWTVTVRNDGPSTATSVRLTDLLPAGLTGATVTVGGVPIDCPGGVCDLGDLAAGADNQVVLIVRGLLDPAYAEPTLANTATVASGTPDPTPGNNEVTSAVPVVGAAHLVVDVSGDATGIAGTAVQWTVAVTDDGPSTARAATVDLVIPAGLEGVSITGPVGSSCPADLPAGTTVTCTLGDLPVGVPVTLTVTGTLSAAYQLPGIVLTATAGSATADPDPGSGDGTDAHSIAVGTSSDLTVTKTGPATAVAGTGIVWTVTVTAAGPSVARNVLVTDPAPSGVTGLTGTWAGGVCGPTGCALGDLAPGAEIVVTFTGTVAAGTPGGPLANVATVTSDTPDPVSTDNTATAITEITRSADLSLTKSVSPDPVVPGEAVTYTITARNNGPSSADGVVVTDQLADVIGDPAATSTVGSCAVTGQAVVCSAPTLQAQEELVVTVTGVLAADTPAGPVANTAAVSATTTDPDPENNGASVDPGTVTADLQVTKTASVEAVLPGDTITWTVAVTNAGPGTARSVLVADQLPAGATLLSVEPATCTGNPLLVCELGDLPAGSTATVTIVAQLADDLVGELTNSATAVSPDESNPGDNVDQVGVPVTASADLSLVKQAAPDEAVAGGAFGWTLTVTNDGPVAATAVRVVDPLPAGFTLDTVPDDCDLVGGTLTCELGTVAVGESVTVDLAGTIAPQFRGALANTATVTSALPDIDPTDNAGTAVVEVTTSDEPLLTKTADRTTVGAGDTVTYTITVLQQGLSTLDDVEVVENLPSGATLVSATASVGDYADGRWTVGTLEPGQRQTLTLQVRLAVAGSSVNTVELVIDGAADGPQASAEVTVLPAEVPPPGTPDPGTPDPGTPGPGTPPTPTAPPTLPNTGVPAQLLSLWALALLLAGAVLLVGTRRRSGRVD